MDARVIERNAFDMVRLAYAELANTSLRDSVALVERRKMVRDAVMLWEQTLQDVDMVHGVESKFVAQMLDEPRKNFDLTEATARTMTVSQEHKALRDAGFSEAVIAKGM